MDKKKEMYIEEQSRGEAHLYVAIAKIDGIVSKNERIFAGVQAAKAQRLYDVLKLNSDIAQRVRGDIASLLSDPRYHDWTSDDHCTEAINILNEVRRKGNWAVSLTGLKHENGLLQTAMLDDYTFAESDAVKKLIRRLERELGGSSS